MEQEYGYRVTFSILALLYPSIDLANKFHIDHVFPRAAFSIRALRKEGLSTNEIEEFRGYKDRVANLQLLEGISNQEKSAKLPSEWLKSATEKRKWRERNYASTVPRSIRGFRQFYDSRRKLMKKALAKELGVKL